MRNITKKRLEMECNGVLILTRKKLHTFLFQFTDILDKK